MTTGKTIVLTRPTFVGKVMSLLFSMLSRLVVTFLPRSRHLLISWLQSPSEVILEPKKIKSDTVSVVSPLFAMKWWDQMPWSSFSECWVLSQLFRYPLSLSLRGSLVLLHFSAIRVVSSSYLMLLIFLLAILIPACASFNLVKGCYWITQRRLDSWPPEENSIWGQRWGLIAQSFCVIKFY